MKKNKPSGFFFSEYPPVDHMLRDLHLLLEPQGDQGATVRAPVVNEICTDQGAMSVGVMAAMVDFLGGWMAIDAHYPDWSATANLCLHTTAKAGPGDFFLGVGSIIRAGHTTAVIDVDLCEKAVTSSQPAISLGSALMTFSRLPRRKDTPKLKQDAKKSLKAIDLASGESRLTQPFIEKAGLGILDEAAGIVEAKMSPYIRNSVGSLHGGIIAIITDMAGQLAARKATGKRLTTSDLNIHYLSQGETGPFRTRTKILRQKDSTVLTRVELIDQGADNRLLAVVMNTATLA